MSISARKLASGKTVYDVWIYQEVRDARGRRKKISRTARTKQEAIRLEATLKVEAMGGGVRDGRTTVGDLMEKWLTAGDGVWSPNTLYRRRCDVARYITPVLGMVKLDRLSATHLDRLYRDLRKQGLANRSILKVHSHLRAALNRAVKWRMIPANPALVATTGPQDGEDGRCATEDEVRALLAAAGPEMAFVIRLACATGIRRSELAGLEWPDVDLNGATLTVRRAVVMVKGAAVAKDTKNHATRVIPLGPSTVAMLKERRGIGRVSGLTPDQLSERLRDLIERVNLGQALRALYGHQPEPGIEGAGFGWHAFRHYAGTSLAGVTDVKTIADILGHKTLVTTERYLHAQTERSRAAVVALDAALG